MNRKLKRAVRDKMRLFNAYRKHQIPQNWEKYRLQRNLTVSIRRDAIRSYFNNKCSTGAKNTDFWPTIKPFLTNKGAKCDKTIMIRVDEKIITDASQVSQHMNTMSLLRLAKTLMCHRTAKRMSISSRGVQTTSKNIQSSCSSITT